MNYKKIFSVTLATALIAAGLVSCAGKNKQSEPVARGGFTGHKEETICRARDDENFFRATGMANGPHPRRDFVKTTAISNAQREILQRVSGTSLGVIDNLGVSIGVNAGTDVDEALRSDIRKIIAQTLNDAAVICGPMYSDVDDKGHLEVIVAIEISKKEVSDKVVKRVESVVPAEDRARLENELNNIGKRIEEAFRAVR